MGSFEGKFFEPNQANTLLAHNGNSDKANPHLMKRIGELQMENQQLKAIVKTMSEEMHNTKKSLEEDRSLKNRELQMSLNEINLLKERINAQKELGFNLKDSNNTLRKELDVLRRELEEAKQEFRERKSVEKEKDRLVKEINMLKEKEANWQVQLHDL